MINGLLGIVNIMSHNFVVAITEKEYVAKIDGSNIYLVKRAELIPFYNSTLVLMQQNS